MDLDEQIEKAKKEMFDSEDALIATGFPEEQWLLIRTYVNCAIRSSILGHLKAQNDAYGNMATLRVT